MSEQKVQKPTSQSEFYELVVGEASTGIMVFHPDDESCIYINRNAREALEVSLDADDLLEMPTLKLRDLFPPEPKTETRPEMGPETRPEMRPETRSEPRADVRALSLQVILAQGFHPGILMRKVNGMAMIANVSIKHVIIENQAIRYLVMFEDITIQKKLQREVEAKQDEIKNAFNEILEQNKQLKELDNAKDRFIALTTHELRTPLSAIVATAEVLELKLYDGDEQRDEFIKTIHEQGLQLMELVNDILDFAKIQAGKMEFYVENGDVVPLVTKLVAGYEQMASQSQITIQTRLAELPMLCYSDCLRLKEVVTNVVSNAIKYNKTGGQVVVSFSMLAETRMARVTVTDTGPGIAAAKIPNVFNEFETVGHVSRHHKGTGLGMPISKRLMQAMGGDLTLMSVEGEGTSFFIDIPTEKVLADEFYRARTDTFGEDLAA